MRTAVDGCEVVQEETKKNAAEKIGSVTRNLSNTDLLEFIRELHFTKIRGLLQRFGLVSKIYLDSGWSRKG